VPRRTARDLVRWLRSSWDASDSAEGLPLADTVQATTLIDPWGVEQVEPRRFHYNQVTLANDGVVPAAGQRLIMGIQATVRPMTVAGFYTPFTGFTTSNYVIRMPLDPDPAFPLEFPAVEAWFGGSGLGRTETRCTSFVGASPRNSYFYGHALDATFAALLQDSDPEWEFGSTDNHNQINTLPGPPGGMIYLPLGAYIMWIWTVSNSAGQLMVACREHLNANEEPPGGVRRVQVAP